MQGCLHSTDRRVDQIRCFLEGVLEDVLEEDAGQLHRRQVADQPFQRLAHIVTDGRFGLDGLGTRGPGFRCLAHAAAPQVVNRPMVCDAEQPRRQRPRLIVGVELPVGVEECVLDDILAVEGGTCHPRAIAMQTGTDVRNGLEKRKVARLESAAIGWVLLAPCRCYASRSSEDTSSCSGGVSAWPTGLRAR